MLQRFWSLGRGCKKIWKQSLLRGFLWKRILPENIVYWRLVGRKVFLSEKNLTVIFYRVSSPLGKWVWFVDQRIEVFSPGYHICPLPIASGAVAMEGVLRDGQWEDHNQPQRCQGFPTTSQLQNVKPEIKRSVSRGRQSYARRASLWRLLRSLQHTHLRWQCKITFDHHCAHVMLFIIIFHPLPAVPVVFCALLQWKENNVFTGASVVYYSTAARATNGWGWEELIFIHEGFRPRSPAECGSTVLHYQRGYH